MTDRSLSRDMADHRRREAGQPQPDLREQLRRAIAEAGFWQYDSLEPHDFQNETTAVLAVVQPLLDTRRAEVDNLVAFIERGFDTHMQFGLINADGTETMLPCADWCHACKLEKAEAEAAELERRNGKLAETIAAFPDANDAANLAHARSERDRLAKQFGFIHTVLGLAQRADFRSELLWHSDGTHITVSVDVSDVFAWGGGDAEDLTPERLPLLAQAVDDLRAIHPSDDMYAVDLYAARVRGMRPQGAAYPKERAATQALFDACGPERPTGLGNPHKPPAPKEN